MLLFSCNAIFLLALIHPLLLCVLFYSLFADFYRSSAVVLTFAVFSSLFCLVELKVTQYRDKFVPIHPTLFVAMIALVGFSCVNSAKA